MANYRLSWDKDLDLVRVETVGAPDHFLRAPKGAAGALKVFKAASGVFGFDASDSAEEIGVVVVSSKATEVVPKTDLAGVARGDLPVPGEPDKSSGPAGTGGVPDAILVNAALGQTTPHEEAAASQDTGQTQSTPPAQTTTQETKATDTPPAQ